MEQILLILESVELRDIVDIAIVTTLFYSITFMFRGTQAVTLFRGIALVVIGLISLAALFRLQALSWLLANSLTRAGDCHTGDFPAGDKASIGAIGADGISGNASSAAGCARLCH